MKLLSKFFSLSSLGTIGILFAFGFGGWVFPYAFYSSWNPDGGIWLTVVPALVLLLPTWIVGVLESWEMRNKTNSETNYGVWNRLWLGAVIWFLIWPIYFTNEWLQYGEYLRGWLYLLWSLVAIGLAAGVSPVLLRKIRKKLKHKNQALVLQILVLTVIVSIGALIKAFAILAFLAPD